MYCEDRNRTADRINNCSDRPQFIGASSGIGAASALEFARHGCRLVLHGRNEQSLNSVSDQCVKQGVKVENILTVLGDLEDEFVVKKVAEETLKRFGTAHVLFNNAGYNHKEDGPIGMGGKIIAMDCMYRIHIRAPYLLTEELLPELIKNKGVVLNCSSAFAKFVNPMGTAYSTMKAAMDHMTRLHALALGHTGVRVNSINPGFVETNIMRNIDPGMVDDLWKAVNAHSALEQRISTPEEIAKTVVFMASDDGSSFCGSNVSVDRGLLLTNQLFNPAMFQQ